MTLPLTTEMLEAAYDYFRTTPPFRRWNLPEPEDITFKIGKDPSCYGWFDKKKKKLTITISTALVGHTQTLMETMAHEMIHLHEDMRGWRSGGEHSAAFKKWAQLVCKIHGFDPKGFWPIDDLKRYGLVYLASPYTRFPRGPEIAFREACAIAADLIRLGIKVYSPIAHTHPIAVHGRLPTLDHEFWIAFDLAMIAKADALLIVQMEAWDQSFGIAEERKAFAGKPIYFLNPMTMAVHSFPHPFSWS